MEMSASNFLTIMALLINIFFTLYLVGVRHEKRFSILETKMDLLYDGFIKRKREDK